MALNSSSFQRKLGAPSYWLKIKPSQTCNLIRWNSCMWNVNCYRCVFIVVVTGRENYDLLTFHSQLINLWNHFTDFDDDDCLQVQIGKKVWNYSCSHNGPMQYSQFNFDCYNQRHPIKSMKAGRTQQVHFLERWIFIRNLIENLMYMTWNYNIHRNQIIFFQGLTQG